MKLILFDIGNVLCSFDPVRAARNFDAVEPGSGADLAHALWRTPLNTAFETGRVTGREVYARVKRRLGLRMAYPDFRRAFNDIFEPIPKNLALLRTLSRRHPTAILSNTNAVHWRHLLATYAPLRAARWRFTSHRLGLMKPHAQAYRAVAARTRIPLQHTLYIDDREDFVQAARRLGVKGIHYRPGDDVADRLAEFGIHREEKS